MASGGIHRGWYKSNNRFHRPLPALFGARDQHPQRGKIRTITMKIILISFLAIIALVIIGCSGTTPIKNLGLPPVTTIEGTITQLDENGFVLTDNSGSVLVRAKLPDNKKLNVSLDEKVKVYGNLQGGQDKIFDGYVIKKSTGEQIIVTKPTPHFGFIIQSSFRE
jgi:hypothetical protein